MAKTKVYNYKIWDGYHKTFSYSESPATREYIESFTPMLEIIETSATEVDIAEIDNEGRVKPKT
ncbi:MAG: hypothetical protein K9G62_06125 [Alphaproteobacteria bacterium]|nr:hypothetical protein [Alphaproteobacteria bacterium]